MKKFLKAAALIAAAVLPLSISACTESEKQSNNSKYFYSMGTQATLLVPQSSGSEEQFNALAGEVEALLDEVENSISATVKGSYIYKFNEAEAGAKVQLDKIAYDVLSLAMETYELTEHYYNPAVYHSVKSYGFPLSLIYPTTLPKEQQVQAFRELASHFDEVELSETGGRYYATKPEFTVTVGGAEYSLAVDLGGIGKGWCADRVDELMRWYGYDYGYFNFGSSSMSLKNYAYSADGAYVLQPRDPRGNGYFCSLKVFECNLSTSGDYEQYYEIEGKRYCHIINPFTGKPIETGVASVTVIDGSAAENDALTTALSCMDKRTAVDFINGAPHIFSYRTVVMLVFEGGVGKIITNRPSEISGARYDIANSVENGRIVLNDVA